MKIVKLQDEECLQALPVAIVIESKEELSALYLLLNMGESAVNALTSKYMDTPPNIDAITTTMWRAVEKLCIELELKREYE